MGWSVVLEVKQYVVWYPTHSNFDPALSTFKFHH